MISTISGNTNIQYAIRWTGTQAGTNRLPITLNNVSLANASIGTVTTNQDGGQAAGTSVAGGAALGLSNTGTVGSTAFNEVQRVTVTGGAGTFTLTYNGTTTAALPLQRDAGQRPDRFEQPVHPGQLRRFGDGDRFAQQLRHHLRRQPGRA